MNRVECRYERDEVEDIRKEKGTSGQIVNYVRSYVAGSCMAMSSSSSTGKKIA
jgi:hypothetical protein